MSKNLSLCLGGGVVWLLGAEGHHPEGQYLVSMRPASNAKGLGVNHSVSLLELSGWKEPQKTNVRSGKSMRYTKCYVVFYGCSHDVILLCPRVF